MDLTQAQRRQVRNALTLIMAGLFSLMLVLGTNDIFQDEMETALYDGQTAAPISTHQTPVLTYPATEAIPPVEYTPTQEMAYPTPAPYFIQLKSDFMFNYGYLREGASTGTAIVGRLYVGERVVHIRTVDGWYETDRGFIASWITIKEH